MLVEDQALLELRNPQGQVRGELRVSLLPGTDVSIPPPLVRLSQDEADAVAQEAVQLLEGQEYRYEIELAVPAGRVTTDLPEAFKPDRASGESGRLRPRLPAF